MRVIHKQKSGDSSLLRGKLVPNGAWFYTKRWTAISNANCQFLLNHVREAMDRQKGNLPAFSLIFRFSTGITVTSHPSPRQPF